MALEKEWLQQEVEPYWKDVGKKVEKDWLFNLLKKKLFKLLIRATTLSLSYIIKGYQIVISPILGNNCRFHPTCSNYAIEALNKKGLTKGLFLSLKRIARCNPFCEGGKDPVE